MEFIVGFDLTEEQIKMTEVIIDEHINDEHINSVSWRPFQRFCAIHLKITVAVAPITIWMM
ncbi:hypothetical protein [Vibrio spartinae]|uniref:hypothetical protein n=1 Tax=Vibrio spartinae TaxID=1918945 RepID=UPI0015FB84B4|nr:hypothetical protein [Vibrio spartinae]